MDPITLGILAVAVAAGLFIKSKPPAGSADDGELPAPVGKGKPATKPKSTACKLAEKNYQNARQLGAPAVPNWDKLTCDEKIVLASPGGPFLAPYIAALGILENGGGLDKAKAAISSAGKSANDAYKTVSKKLGF